MQTEFMLKAAEQAESAGIDIPIGAVIVKGGEIIAAAANECEKTHNPQAHAEMLAIQRACSRLKSKRLNGCEIYVTLEPCPMCAAALLLSGISAVYFGAYDVLYGAFGSKTDMRQIMNIKAEVKGGIMEEECSSLLKNYFKNLRNVKAIKQ